jgi:hypothetical protein
MPAVQSKHDLIAELQKQVSAHGLKSQEDAEGIARRSGKNRREVVARRPQGRLLHVMPAERAGSHRSFPRSIVERSWRIAPPTLKLETTSVSGWKRSGTRKEVSVGGSGTLDYAEVRNAVEKARIPV